MAVSCGVLGCMMMHHKETRRRTKTEMIKDLSRKVSKHAELCELPTPCLQKIDLKGKKRVDHQKIL
jgi:hypothetical protein